MGCVCGWGGKCMCCMYVCGISPPSIPSIHPSIPLISPSIQPIHPSNQHTPAASLANRELCALQKLHLTHPSLHPSNTKRPPAAPLAGRELCALQKLGGVPLATEEMLRWCDVAQAKASTQARKHARGWHKLINRWAGWVDGRMHLPSQQPTTTNQPINESIDRSPRSGCGTTI